ncbi:MAG: hypothetical protein WCR27_01935 [Eubacteriales bacterium]
MKNLKVYLLGIGTGLIISAIIVTLFGIFDCNKILFERTYQKVEEADKSDKVVEPKKEEYLGNKSMDMGQTKAENDTSKNVEVELVNKKVTIDKGATAIEIADILCSEGIIKDKQKFLDIVNNNNISRNFIAGEYNLSTNEKEDIVINILQNNGQVVGE